MREAKEKERKQELERKKEIDKEIWRKRNKEKNYK